MGLTRRKFLLASGAALGGALLVPPARLLGAVTPPFQQGTASPPAALGVPTSALSTNSYTSSTSTPELQSVSPTAGAIMCLAAHIGQGAGDPQTIVDVSDDIGDSGGGSWTEQVNPVGTDGGGNDGRLIIYTRVVGTGPGSGTITVTLSDTSPRIVLGVVEYTGQDDSPTGETDSANEENNGAGSIILTGVTLGAGNNIFCAAGSRDNGDIVPGDGVTEIVQINTDANGRNISICTATQDPSWTGLDGSIQVAGAVEIVAEGAAEEASQNARAFWW